VWARRPSARLRRRNRGAGPGCGSHGVCFVHARATAMTGDKHNNLQALFERNDLRYYDLKRNWRKVI